MQKLAKVVPLNKTEISSFLTLSIFFFSLLLEKLADKCCVLCRLKVGYIILLKCRQFWNTILIQQVLLPPF